MVFRRRNERLAVYSSRDGTGVVPCTLAQVLIMAFEDAHFNVLADAAEQKLNARLSGTTTAVALVKPGLRLWARKRRKIAKWRKT